MRLAILAIALAACRYEGQFPCTQDVQCRIADNAGTCEQTGWCSFVDEDCTSRRRFDETAGDGLAGTCVPGPAGCETWNAHFFTPCALPPPSGNLSISGSYLYDTTDGSLTEVVTMTKVPQPSTVVDGSRYLSVQDVTISTASQLRVAGDLPLVIVAWGSISIMVGGTIDAGSHNGVGGPGSNPAGLCAVGEGVDTTATVAGGGGGGGGFQGAGGKGGGGAAAGTSVALPQTLRGGCSGGRSGNAGSTAIPPALLDTHASPGKGGGALVLSGRLSVTIDGIATVGGEGGGGSPMGAGCGGAGGGAGGLLVVEAPTVAIHGQAIATGGGGGGVAEKTDKGMKGRDAAATGAAGGTPGNNCNGTGGTGSTTTTTTGGDGGTASCGGAGGGGGSGWILLLTQNFDMVGSTLAPIPNLNPF